MAIDACYQNCLYVSLMTLQIIMRRLLDSSSVRSCLTQGTGELAELSSIVSVIHTCYLPQTFYILLYFFHCDDFESVSHCWLEVENQRMMLSSHLHYYFLSTNENIKMSSEIYYNQIMVLDGIRISKSFLHE